MKIAIVGCNMIRGDLEPLLTDLPYEPDCFWLDETLHNTPPKLHDALQQQIDALQDYDLILLTYLLCGNALVGIRSEKVPLRFLQGDDCIYACMCGRDDYMKLRTSALFLSRGWLSTARNPLTDYENTVKRYGAKRARYIYDVMYGNYRNVVYMELDGKGPSPEDREKVLSFCELLHLEPLYLEGSTSLYARLFSLEECEDVMTAAPGHVIDLKDCGLFR